MDLKAIQKVALQMARSAIQNQLEGHNTELASMKRKIKQTKNTLALLAKFEKELDKPDEPIRYAIAVPTRSKRKTIRTAARA